LFGLRAEDVPIDLVLRFGHGESLSRWTSCDAGKRKR